MEKEEPKNNLHIQMFGHFKVNGLGGMLDEDNIRSDMLTRLLGYLMCHRNKEITTQELAEILWHDDDSDNPVGALKNLIYRLRTIMKKQWPEYDFIITGRGAYRWNPAVEVITDMEQFENHYKAAVRIKDNVEKIKELACAVKLYRGTFMPKLSGEYWVASLATYYHSMFLDAVKECAVLLETEHYYKEMAQICSHALRLDNLDERIHCYFIKALIQQKEFKLAAEQYKKAVDTLYENLGVTPSEELRKVYDELLKETHDAGRDIGQIQQELNDELLKGAFVCEYGVFKKTYQLEKRRSERMGISVFLSVIDVVPILDVKHDSQAFLNIVNTGMERLENVLLRFLRAGDVISKYSGTQYVVLLPTCQYETAKMVMQRIERAFVTEFKKKVNVKLQYSLDEIGFQNQN